MNQYKRFKNPVYKTDFTNTPIAIGDTVKFILWDGTEQDETVTDSQEGGRKVYWDHSVNDTRKEDVRAVASIHHKSCLYYGGATDPGGETILWD